MAHEYILADLLARNEGAVGSLFLDETGETVDLACSEFGPYQMKVLGAYIGIYLKQLQEFLALGGHGDPSWLHVEKEDLHIYAMPLPDGYFVVLVQRGPAIVAQARRSLAHARDQLTRELFTSS